MNQSKKILLILGASSDLGCELIRKEIANFDLIIGHYNHINDALKELKDLYTDKLELMQADFSDID